MGSARGLGPAIATIDLAALRANVAEAFSLAKGTGLANRTGPAEGRALIGVVKADAYGHGATPVARTLIEAGAAMLATWSVGEAVVLRDAGIDAPLLSLSGVRDAEEADEAVARGLACVLHDPAARDLLAEAAHRRGTTTPVHIEVDTGMRRMGVPCAEAAGFVASVAEIPELTLAGVMTHFARADEADLAPTRAQQRDFAGVLDAVRSRGIGPGMVHAANSAGLAAADELAADGPPTQAVRPGLLLYGVQPSVHRPVTLRPVMSLRAPVVALRRVRKGDAVGYSARYHAPRDTWIATLGIGYADGVPISATARGSVWLGGERCPIAGRVSMDYVTVEVSETAVARAHVGAEAVIFGCEAGSPDPVVPIEEAAEAAQTISYELLVRVGSRVRREFTDGDALV